MLHLQDGGRGERILWRTETDGPAQASFYACSTPTLKTNYIWELHDNADEVRHYFVRCPHCGKWIEFVFKQIEFADDDEHTMSNYERAQTAVYICQECNGHILDADKPKMLREGEWRVVKKRGTGKPRSVGFWLSALYSIFLKWSDIAEEWLECYDDPEKRQNFTNSWLAESWEDTQLKTTEDLVKERQTGLDESIVPAWAKMLTAGVDIQETSLYYTIRAYGDGGIEDD